MNKVLLAIILLLTNCRPAAAQLFSRDFYTPELLNYYCPEQGTLIMEFDEEVQVVGSISSAEKETKIQFHSDENRIILNFIPAGNKDDCFRFCVSDKAGNSYELMIPVSYWPENQAELLINEVMSKGSRTRPDFIEIKVTKPGVTDGFTVNLGSRTHFSYSIPLPPREVKTGDFILIDFDKSLSGNPAQKEKYGWRFFPEEENGISGNNGIISLYSHPLSAKAADCLIYSNRQDKSIESKNGWTSSLYEMVYEIENSGIWNYSGDHLTPDDALDSTSSTSTRSFNRNQSKNSGLEAWYICESSGRSPGEENRP